MFYVLLVALAKITALTFVVWRLWCAKQREAARADANARGWQEARFQLQQAAVTLSRTVIERDTATIRLEEITNVITRRPPRRKWLRICYRVAKLADLTTRGKRLSA